MSVSGTLGAGGRAPAPIGGRGNDVGGMRGTDGGGGGAALIPPTLGAPPSPGLPGGGRIAGDAGNRPADGAGAGTGRRPVDAGPAPGAAGALGSRRELSGGGAARWMRGPDGRPPWRSRSADAGAGKRGLDAGGGSMPGLEGAGRRGLDAGGIPRTDGGSVSSRLRRMRGFEPCGSAAPRAVRSPNERTDAGGGVFGSMSSSTSRYPATANDVPGVESNICGAGAARSRPRAAGGGGIVSAVSVS